MVFQRIASGACAAAAFCGALCGVLALSGCGLEPTPGHCGTEVPDPTDTEVAMWGCVEKDGGPAVAARVIAWPHDDASRNAALDDARIDRDTQYTDSRGRFVFRRTLAEGHYDLFFEDSAAVLEKKSAVERLPDAYRPPPGGRMQTGTTRLRPPGMLLLTVKDNDSHEPLVGAECAILQTPFRGRSGEAGVVPFILPPGRYDVSCQVLGLNSNRIAVDIGEGSEAQPTLYLRQSPQPPNPLPPPENFKVEYDENSGIAFLSWSPVADSRLFKYGIRKVDMGLGSGVEEFTIGTPYFSNPAFNRMDTVQEKRLLYSVYSLKQDAGGFVTESRSPPVTRAYARPWSSGPRIDTLALLAADGDYQAGDTVRIAAAWANRVRANSRLFWRVRGVEEIFGERRDPSADGADTLSFVLPSAGGFEIGIMIEDAEGYRSWRSQSFQFYGSQPTVP